MKVQDNLAEGKTKVILSSDKPGLVLIRSKDSITAGDGAKKDEIVRKGIHANQTTCNVFAFLNACGMQTHFVETLDERTFLAKQCDMIPLEVVARRFAFGSYLKRHPGTPEKSPFNPPLVEFFLKDDANHDPFMEPYTILHDKITSRDKKPITRDNLEMMENQCRLIFELLERAWALGDVTLVDLKVEFGFSPEGTLILSDVIDNDSWRVWPHGEKAKMKDKQVYRNLDKVTPEALLAIEANYREVAEATRQFMTPVQGKVMILLGSKSDESFIRPMIEILEKLEVPHDTMVASAHKTTRKLLEKISAADGLGQPIVFIAVAGRSNGLGPVTDGNTTFPVINCPALSEKFSGEELLSSLYLPSGLSCTTVLDPQAAGLAAAKMLSLNSPLLFGKLRVIRSRW